MDLNPIRVVDKAVDKVKDLGKDAIDTTKTIAKDVTNAPKNIIDKINPFKKKNKQENNTEENQNLPIIQKTQFTILNKTFTIEGNFTINVVENFKIQDGTYTAMTFKNGNLINLGLAPLPIYTPNDVSDNNLKKRK